jgi:hypothetical protein
MLLLDAVLHLRCGRNDSLCIPENQSASLQSPMKKISNLFTDEEKKHLSYLGSMLRSEPSAEEAETQEIYNAVEKHGMKIKGEIVCPFKKKD